MGMGGSFEGAGGKAGPYVVRRGGGGGGGGYVGCVDLNVEYGDA